MLSSTKVIKHDLQQKLKIIQNEQYKNIQVNNFGINLNQKLIVFYFYFNYIATLVYSIGKLIDKPDYQSVPVLNLIIWYQKQQCISSVLFSFDFVFYGPLIYYFTQRINFEGNKLGWKPKKRVA